MDIYNWDMVCAASCAELNKKLKSASREAFGEFSWSDDEGNQISGEFDGWEIVPGGDAQRINIITPLCTGRLQATILGKPVDVAVDGLCPELQVELAFVNAGNGDNTTHLKFNFAHVSKTRVAVTAGNGSVVVLNPDTDQLFPASEAIIPELYSDTMAQMLVAMRDKITFILAEVMDIPAGNDTSWMKPVLMAYAYNEKLSGELGCLAVLCTLDDADDNGYEPLGPVPERQLIFDSALVREGGSMGFMLSRHMFMKRIVLPGLPGVLEGSSLSQYYLDGSDVIRNNGGISLSPLDGYTPWFTSFAMEVIDDRIVLNNASGRCDVVSYSSYVSFDLAATYAPRLNSVGGQSQVSLEGVTTPVLNVEIHDTAAKVFWIFGGWVVDALVHGIRDGMNNLLFVFSQRINFDIWPVTFSTDARYSSCGLAGNFFMQD